MENNKKKVGIVTFHTDNNYGAVLQAYALQSYVERNLNCKASIIDLHTSCHDKDNEIFKNKASNKIKCLVKNTITLLHIKSLLHKKKAFELFRSQYLHLTSHCYKTQHDFLYNIEEFDYYISGSDQVFNPTINHSECYYLNFQIPVAGKKVAYAPSFGISSFTNDEVLKIKKYVEDFSALSCREKDGADFLSKLIGTIVPHVCDPVFLLNREEWNKLAYPPKTKESFIFVYDLNGGHKLIELAKKVSIAHNNIPIICATGHIFNVYRGVKSLYNVGPCELLGFIKNADFVVTDSFHGTALSLIMDVKVITYIAAEHTSSRIKSLLKRLCIESQIVSNVESFNMDQIVFRSFKESMERYILESKDFLSKALQ